MEAFLGLDYPTIWFLVVGGLFSGYGILDGFDFGAGAWHLFLKKEESRRLALNAVGPVWDGNEVWLVIGGGALFAGFPVFYSILFSFLYIPFILFLIFLIFRGIAIEFRGKEPMQWWKNAWDIAYCVSSILLAFSLGLMAGNVLQGLPIGKDYSYHGDALFDFINPFALLTGFTTLFLFMAHGAIFLILKTKGLIRMKMKAYLKISMGLFIVLFVATSIYIFIYLPDLTSFIRTNEWALIVPILVILSIANVTRLNARKKFFKAFIFSAITVALMMGLVAMELYPVLLRSTIHPSYDITIYNAAASIKTLKIMLIFVAIGGPLVLSYTIFVYKTFSGKVKIDEHSY